MVDSSLSIQNQIKIKMLSQRPSMRSFVQCEEDESPVLHDEESILFQLTEVELAFEARNALGRGKLYVTTSRIVWIGKELAFDFDVPFVVLHSITRDTNSYSTPCLYCQLDQFDGEWGENDDDEEEEEEEEGEKLDEGAEVIVEDGKDAAGGGGVGEEELMKDMGKSSASTGLTSWTRTRTGEMYLSPLDESHLKAIYDAFSHAALLNPDPLEDGHEEGDDELIYDIEEVALGAEQARALAHLESVFIAPGEVEDDAEEEDEEEYEEGGEEGNGGQFDDVEN